ncbi:F-box/kelch-repeat protein At3g23880-like [Vicia villosa]|uniref:F-box/kelch-repeat protein At3g23880-like n=1 Tax=Vicia villosa TaxID=3911 RepID=UPI00273CDC3E|nr:F-box/kelch-repeat protein At3g23880-like [Vicia villosa]
MATNITQHEFSSKDVFRHKIHDIVGSCDGILCLANYYKPLIVLCNPSIRKFKELSPFDNPRVDSQLNMTCGFGYDHVSHNYKVVVVYNFTVKGQLKGRNSDPPFIVSFDLDKESYQKVFLPDLGEIDVFDLTLGVLRDCLCLIHDDDVWFMREYGIKESWIKLFDLSYLQDSTKPSTLTKVLYLFEDDNVLLEFIYFEKKKLILYNSKNGSFKKGSFKNAAMFQNTLEVCVESLISPCF